MSRFGRHLPMLVWAAREIQRRPGRTMLLFAALASLVFMVASVLLFGQALDTTWTRLMAKAPDLIVRRIDAGGWAPLPIDAAMARVKGIPGVLDPTPRLWGVAAAGTMPVTVVTAANVLPTDALTRVIVPAKGQAVVGQARFPVGTDKRLTLTARETMTFNIVGTLPADTGLATHDLVWLTPGDARRLLGIPAGHASDLAVRLFRPEEIQALAAELAAAFPWPVTVTDRNAAAIGYRTRAIRTGTLRMLVALPAGLALLLIVAGTLTGGRDPHQRLLRAMGWTTADLLRLQLAGALIVALPAIMVGLAAAYAVVFWPPAAGITALWLSDGRHLPALVLSRDGSLVVMLTIAGLVGLPYLAAVFLTTLRGAADAVWPLSRTEPWN